MTRWKEGMSADVFERRPVQGRIPADEIIGLSDSQMARRVRALVVVDRQERPMTFLTSQTEWSAPMIVDPYGCRGESGLFFKQLK